MVSVEEAFFGAAIIIFIGYFGLLLFKKTKIPEILFLMVVGLLIGPIFGFFGEGELSVLKNFLPFFASFALMIVLFEGGMQLNFFKTLRALPDAFIFTLTVFILTVGFISVAWFLFTGDLLVGALLGTILGGTSSAIIIPLVNNTSARDETKMLLGLESALTDALCVISAVAIASTIYLVSSGNAGGIGGVSVGSSILSAFSIATVLGVLFGFGWLKVLPFFEKKPYEYLFTIGVLMFLYSVVEFFKGNGAIAALTFGVVLGNSFDLLSMLRFSPKVINSQIKSFQMEITFLVRTFFFVYLGLLFSISYLNDMVVILMALIIMVIILFTRFVGAKIISKFNKVFSDNLLFITTMNGRGLAAASLIFFPTITMLNLGDTFAQLAAIVFLVILLSNITTTIGVFVSEKQLDSKKKKGVLIDTLNKPAT